MSAKLVMLSGVCRHRLSSSVTLHGGPVSFRSVRPLLTTCYWCYSAGTGDARKEEMMLGDYPFTELTLLAWLVIL